MSLLCLCIWNDDGCICGTLYNRISSTHIVIVFIFNIITNQTHLEDDVQLVVVGFSIQPNLNPVQHSFQIFLLVPLTNVCKESKSSPRLNCVESATCESQQ